MSDLSEECEWFLVFEEVFKELNDKKLAPIRRVADEKFLLFSIKLIGFFVCPDCNNRWNSTNSQVKFSYRIVTKHRRGEVRICKRFGTKCRTCYRSDRKTPFRIPRIDNDHKLYAMECLHRLVCYYFYGIDEERPTIEYKGSGEHFAEGCEACECGECRANPLFRGVLIDKNVSFNASFSDDNPRPIVWRLYFGDDKQCFQPTFEDNFKKEVSLRRQQPPPGE